MRICTTPGCPELVEGGRCSTHLAEARARHDEARGTAAERGYDAAWARARAARLAHHPWCKDCGKRATDVHHHPRRLVLVAQGVTDPDAERYLVSLCHACHSKRTGRGE